MTHAEEDSTLRKSEMTLAYAPTQPHPNAKHHHALDTHVGPWTVDDILALPEDLTGTRYELIDGSLITMPTPSVKHQIAAAKLSETLRRAGKAHNAFAVEGLGVTHMSGMAIPDVTVLPVSTLDTLDRLVPAELTLTVVEIVSPGSRKMDRLLKPSFYAESGAPCYWRVELDPVAIHIYQLRDGQYQEIETTTDPDGLLHTPLPYPVTLNAAMLTTSQN